jgi:hypothetical protein
VSRTKWVLCLIQKGLYSNARIDGFSNLIIKLSEKGVNWEIKFMLSFFLLLLFSCILPILLVQKKRAKVFSKKHRELQNFHSRAKWNGLKTRSWEPDKRAQHQTSVTSPDQPRELIIA